MRIQNFHSRRATTREAGENYDPKPETPAAADPDDSLSLGQTPAKPAQAMRPPQPRQGFAQMVRAIEQPISPSRSRAEQPGLYQQSQPKWVDPEGDAQLVRMVDKVPEEILTGVWNYLAKGQKWHDHGGPASTPVVSGPRPHIEVDELISGVQAVIGEHPEFEPHIGPEHKWSPEAEQYFGFGFFSRVGDAMLGRQDFPAPMAGSKLLAMLATGSTARFAVTGQEKALEDRLMTYQDGQVGLLDMVRESYRLHQGDLYQTLLCAENILAADVNAADREHQPIQKKLRYLRDDQPQAGDNFGAWYHFFGTALYALMRPEFIANTVAVVESAGSLIMEGPDRQETLVNVYGASLGTALREMSDTRASG